MELVRDWIPVGDAKATIVLVHGIAEHSGRYEHVGGQLSDSGYRVRSFDLIGAGGSGGDRWDIDDWTRYHDQIDGHMKWAREQGGPVILMGHSMGGNLALGYALAARSRPDLLVLSAPALGGGAGWQRALAPFMAKLIPTVVMPNGVKAEHLSNDAGVGERYFADPLVIPKSTVRLGSALFKEMDYLNANIEKLAVPTMCIHGGSDKLVPTQSSAALGSLDVCDRTIYPGLQHEILNEPESPEIVQDVMDWINARL
jgi:alpha-beta hydrolase superfamily lysophospholipase